MATNEELDALDRKWAGLIHPGAGRHRRYSRIPAYCFGPDGPWEWLVENTVEWEGEDDEGNPKTWPPVIVYCYGPNDYAVVASIGEGAIDAGGTTLFEAVTNCAIEAFKKLNQKKEEPA